MQIFPRLWRYALALSGSRTEADELTQSACLRALERSAQFDPSTSLDKWVFRIIHNLWLSDRRRHKVRTGQGLVSIDVIDIVDPGLTADHHMERRELLQAILDLPEAQRQAAIIVYVEGYSYRDASMILGIPVGTVMSRLAAARNNLARQMGGQRGGRHARSIL
ncbi:MAG: RNA polymerase sigma factor [Pseudomonadota bacterium]